MGSVPDLLFHPLKSISPAHAALLAVLFFCAGFLPGLGDDVGLITVKLTEQAEHAYLLEVDVPPKLVEALGTPVLPDGFKPLATEFDKRGELINVRYPFTGETWLTPDQAILLPWTRNGALINARWLDGSRSSHMFSATVKGIEIEISKLKPLAHSRSVGVRDGFQGGIEAFLHHAILWLPLLCIGFLFPPAQAIRFLAMLLSGLTAALIILDFVAITIPMSVGLSIMMAAVIIAIRLPDSRLSPLFAAAACVLGLASTAELPSEARTAFIAALCICLLAAGALAILVRWALPEKVSLKPLGPLLGGIAFAAILITLWREPEVKPAVEEPLATLPITARPAASKTPATLDKPFVTFLTIEPYEVRFEVMATGHAVADMLTFPLKDPRSIQVSEQATMKEQMLRSLAPRFTLRIDGQTTAPALQSADFLTLGAAGAFTRTEAVDEAMDTAILGLTFAYPLTSPPNTLDLTWSQLPTEGSEFPITILEPAGITGHAFSSSNPELNWENRSDELRPSTIAAVDVDRPTWAILTFLLLVAGLILMARSKEKIGYVCLVLALVSAPFIRSTQPFASPLQEEESGQVIEELLANIYRSFDFRQESTIYDQLAISVTGDQLSEIYLGQRRALELENRGGARARVDNVEVESIQSLQPAGDGVDVHARWNVSGSVNHFGHTHYRQNAYDAILHLIPIDGAWKIASIEVNDEKRIY